SDMGPDGDTSYAAQNPAVAYNPNLNQYLVVWSGDDNSGGLTDNDFQIFGQFVLPRGGQIGTNDFRISNMDTGSIVFGANFPAVTYNSRDGKYLVVWSGDDNAAGGAGHETEIFGQQLQENGDFLRFNFAVSDMGAGGINYRAFNPAVTYNSQDNEYLVVWWGTDNANGVVKGEFEIFGQRLMGVDAFFAIGDNDFRISNMGPNGDLNYAAFDPSVVYNQATNQYLVVWEGTISIADDDSESEIFGQLLDAFGVETGENDFRISRMGADNDPNFDAFEPQVAYDSEDGRFLVVWQGDNNNVNGLVDSENEIFGQLLNSDGSETGADDFRLSDMGPDGNPGHGAFRPGVACQTGTAQCLIVWDGDDDIPPLTGDEFEIFGQLIGSNNPPLASPDSYTTPTDTTLSIAVPGVLANDSDADGDPLHAVLVSGVANGSLNLSEDGAFTYTPDTGFIGTNSFTYLINDGLNNSDPATVTIVVAEPGTLTNQIFLPLVVR
ncbi:MAG: cadherin-like domain-containing protein, partial [Anaerolineales bacterium]|nr:cadherin-like domain-containing protein [Anaerolineales bacterium]